MSSPGFPDDAGVFRARDGVWRESRSCWAIGVLVTLSGDAARRVGWGGSARQTAVPSSPERKRGRSGRGFAGSPGVRCWSLSPLGKSAQLPSLPPFFLSSFFNLRVRLFSFLRSLRHGNWRRPAARRSDPFRVCRRIVFEGSGDWALLRIPRMRVWRKPRVPPKNGRLCARAQRRSGVATHVGPKDPPGTLRMRDRHRGIHGQLPV